MINLDRLVSVTMAGSPLERVEPITLDEAKDSQNYPLALTDRDNQFRQYIAAARGLFEAEAGHACIDQMWEYRYRSWQNGPSFIDIPRPPMTSLISVTSRDLSGVETELDPSLYSVVLSGVPSGSPPTVTVGIYPPPGRLELLSGASWPVGHIIIRRVCGYGPTAAHVPEFVKSALYFLVGHFFRNRAEVTAESVKSIPLGAEAMIRAFKYAGLPVQ